MYVTASPRMDKISRRCIRQTSNATAQIEKTMQTWDKGRRGFGLSRSLQETENSIRCNGHICDRKSTILRFSPDTSAREEMRKGSEWHGYFTWQNDIEDDLGNCQAWEGLRPLWAIKVVWIYAVSFLPWKETSTPMIYQHELSRLYFPSTRLGSSNPQNILHPPPSSGTTQTVPHHSPS